LPKGVRYRRWNFDDKKRALEAGRNGDVGLNATSREYSVPKATPKRHLDGKNYFTVENTQVIGRVGDIPPHAEEELANHILKLEQYMFGIITTDLQLEFEVDEIIIIVLRDSIKRKTWKEMPLWVHETASTTKSDAATSYIYVQVQ
jgi:hypothetical protein